MKALLSSLIIGISVLVISGCGKSEVSCEDKEVMDKALDLYRPYAMTEAAFYTMHKVEYYRPNEEIFNDRDWMRNDEIPDINDLSDTTKDKMRDINLSLSTVRTDAYDPEIKKKMCVATLHYTETLGKDISYSVQETSSDTIVEVYGIPTMEYFRRSYFPMFQ
jgi:hypothetical protein